MNFPKTIRITHLLFLLVACTFFISGCDRGKPEPTLGDLGPEIGLSFPGAENYKITQDLARQGGQKRFRSLEAVNGARLLKIEIMTGFSVKEAGKIREQRMNIIRSLFSNLPSPYPGMMTNTVKVDDDLRPQALLVPSAGQKLPLYILKSNSRYTYGAVPRKMVSFLGGLFFLYDESRETLYRFDYFIPKEEAQAKAFVRFFSQMKLRDGEPSAQFAENIQKTAGTARPAAPHKDRQIPLEPGFKYKGYNLILIAFEPLGANHMSCYGYKRKTSPNLDAFARDATLFENAVSPSSWSLPVFMSWFTSLYPSEHKVTNQYSKYTKTEKVPANLFALSPGVVTMPQVLKQNGYRTAGFTGGASLAGKFGFSRGFDTYYDKENFAGFDSLMPKAAAWLKRNGGQKFFLFLQGYDVHGRFPLDKRNLQKFLGDDYHGTYTGTKEEYWQLRNRSVNEGRFPMTKEDIRFWKAVYDTKIFAADKRFGSFIKQLKNLNLLDNSIIIVSAGSGNEYHEHGRIDHGFSLYDELLHVPLIIRIPKRHGKVSQLVRTLDIMPTVLDLLDLQVKPAVAKQPYDNDRMRMQGVSLVPAMRGKYMSLDGVSETDYLLHSFKRSIRTSDGWKFILSLDTDKRELYNLKDDPGEQKNVIQENGRKAYELEQGLFKVLRGGAQKK